MATKCVLWRPQLGRMIGNRPWLKVTSRSKKPGLQATVVLTWQEQAKMKSGGKACQASISSLVKFRTPAFSSDGAKVGSSRRYPLTKCQVFSAGTTAVSLCWVVRAKVETRPRCAFFNLIYVRYNQRAVSHSNEGIGSTSRENLCGLGNIELQDGGLGRPWRWQVLQCQALDRRVLRAMRDHCISCSYGSRTSLASDREAICDLSLLFKRNLNLN